MTKQLYIIDVFSQHLTKYCVEIENLEELKAVIDSLNECPNEDGYTDHPYEEFSSQFLGEKVFSHRPITKEEYLTLFDKDNAYISNWSEEDKFTLVNDVEGYFPYQSDSE